MYHSLVVTSSKHLGRWTPPLTSISKLPATNFSSSSTNTKNPNTSTRYGVPLLQPFRSISLSVSSSSSSSVVFRKWKYCSSNNQRSYYTFAIARDVPNSFENALSEHYQVDDGNNVDTKNDDTSTTVNLALAQEQHHKYVEQLRTVVPVLCLPADETLPDCCFVEDTAVVIDNIAVITRLGHVNRQKECTVMKQTLQQLGFGVSNNQVLYDMNEVQPIANSNNDPITCDGGDVLYTTDSPYIFVGLSNRTTVGGANVLQDCFSNQEVIVVPPVVQGQQVLHLKSCVTHMDPTTLVVPEGSLGDQLLDAMKASDKGYSTVRIPDLLACNVVYCGNETILVQDTPCAVSRQRLEYAATERNLNIIYINTQEKAKKDAALTCCSILLNI